MNKNMPDIANETKRLGIDAAMSTNGVLLTEEVIRECLASFSWIRFSVASLNESVYQQVHRCKEGDLERLKTNLAYAVEYKKRYDIKTTLGVQCLLLPQTVNYVEQMAKELRDMGVDYFTIKPYKKVKQSENFIEVDYEPLLEMERELKKYETENYKIYFRARAMKQMKSCRNYENCYGLNFMAYIDSKGDVSPCCDHVGVKNFYYGNIYQNSFVEIWEGNLRKKVMDKINSCNLDVLCPEACRLDAINEYLNELKFPDAHVNFI